MVATKFNIKHQGKAIHHPPSKNDLWVLPLPFPFPELHNYHCCDYGEVSCDVTGYTYNSILTVNVVSAGVLISGCLKARELLLGTRGGVHLDSGDRRVRAYTLPSSHHDPVLEFNGTSRAENEDKNLLFTVTIAT